MLRRGLTTFTLAVLTALAVAAPSQAAAGLGLDVQLGTAVAGLQDAVRSAAPAPAASDSGGGMNTRSHTQCSDGVDNDGDGFVDTADSGCTSADDTTEGNRAQCEDGVDNDRDGLVDMADADCNFASDQYEGGSCRVQQGQPVPQPPTGDCGGTSGGGTGGGTSGNNNNPTTQPRPTSECSDGRDNDGDGYFDFNGRDSDGDGDIDQPADPDCSSLSDNDENNFGGQAPTQRCDSDNVPDTRPADGPLSGLVWDVGDGVNGIGLEPIGFIVEDIGCGLENLGL